MKVFVFVTGEYYHAVMSHTHLVFANTRDEANEILAKKTYGTVSMHGDADSDGKFWQTYEEFIEKIKTWDVPEFDVPENSCYYSIG